MIPYTRHNILFSVNGFNVPTEGLFFAIGYLVFFYLIYKGIKKDKSLNFTNKEIIKLIIGVIISANLFGRLLFFLIPWRGFEFLLKFFYAGGSFLNTLGTFVGAFVFIILFLYDKYGKNMKSQLIKILDIVALPGGLLVFFVRLGCFLDGHVIGAVTNVPWCIMSNGVCRHPLAFYYATAGFLVFLTLIIFFSNEKKGIKAAWFGILFPLSRFFNDFFKESRNIIFLNIDFYQTHQASLLYYPVYQIIIFQILLNFLVLFLLNLVEFR